MLDAEHALDVGTPVHARTALRFRDAEVREFRFPGAQDVGLNLRDLADLRLSEQRPLRDLGGVHGGHADASRQYSKVVTDRTLLCTARIHPCSVVRPAVRPPTSAWKHAC